MPKVAIRLIAGRNRDEPEGQLPDLAKVWIESACGMKVKIALSLTVVAAAALSSSTTVRVHSFGRRSVV